MKQQSMTETEISRERAVSRTARAFKAAETAFHEALRAKGPSETRREFEAYTAARRELYAAIDALATATPGVAVGE